MVAVKLYDVFQKELAILKTATIQDLSNDFVVSGICYKFRVQFDLSWKILKELLKYEGCYVPCNASSREIIKEAYKIYDFLDEEIWLSMLKDRYDMTSAYDSERAKSLVAKILGCYIPALIALQENIGERYRLII